jgi:hypothetical protein
MMAKNTDSKKELGVAQQKALLETLRGRFENNMARHRGVAWAKVAAKLQKSPGKLWSLAEMEGTGGEPDVVGVAKGAFLFYDCAKESPAGRRSVCYDGQARKERKQHAPKNSAVEMANDMGADILTREEYQRLQKLGEFDTKTSSWLSTPDEIRTLGGAIFGDRRYDTVFVYHNGAESYYAARGFRCSLKV